MFSDIDLGTDQTDQTDQTLLLHRVLLDEFHHRGRVLESMRVLAPQAAHGGSTYR